MHGVAILVGIEAALVAGLHMALRGDWYRTCVYLVALTAPLEVYRTTVRDLNPSLFRLSLAIAAVTVVVGLARDRGTSWREVVSARMSPLAGACLVLLLAVAASIAANGDTFLGRRLVAVLVVGIVAMVVLAELARRTSLRTLAVALVAGALLPIVAACWQVLGPKLGGDPSLPLLSELPVAEGLEQARSESAVLSSGATVEASTRLKGTFVDPNHFGAYLVFVLAVAAALTASALRLHRRDQALAFGALGLATVAILVGTYSRSAWVAAAVAAAVAALALGPSLWRSLPPRALIAGLAALAVMGLAAVALPDVRDRLSPSSAVNASSNVLHRENAEAGLDAFRERPLLGIGPGELSARLNAGVRTSAADSTYVTVIAELGAVGLFALLLTAGFAMRALWRGARDPVALALAAAYSGFLVANVFYDQLWWRDFHFTVLGLALAFGALRAPAPRRSEVPARAPGHPPLPAR
jgi:hypothetical protein